MNGPFQVAQANIATQTSGKPPTRIVKVTKPFGDQSVVVPLSYDGSVKADLSSIAGENITLVHIGEKLIILFDNKSTVTLEPFFDANGAPLNGITVEVSPGRDLTGTEFAALFPVTEDRSILPAAGDGNGSGAQASGANFTSVGVDPLAAPNPIDLLGQEDLPNFTINTLLRQNDFINGIPSALGNGVVALDEDEIPGVFGNSGGPGDIDAPHTFSGTLAHDFGLDGAGSIGLEAMNGVSQVINGVTVKFTWNEATHTLTANDGSGDVFQVVITNPATGDYTVTLLGPLHHHTDALADNSEAGDVFNLTYTVTDSNGTTATGTLTLEINDDTPVAHDSAPTDTTVVIGEGEGQEGNGEVVTQYATIDDDAQGGNAGDDTNGDDAGESSSVSGKLNIEPGADGLKAVAFTGLDGQPHVTVTADDGSHPALQVIFVNQAGIGTPENVTLVWHPDGNGGGTLIGISDHFSENNPAFTLTVDSQGNYTFDVHAPFAQPLTNDGSEGSAQIGWEDNIHVQFTYTATDGDGDKASATLTFNIDDDTPTVDVTANGRGNEGQQEHALLVSLDESIGGDRGANGAPDGDRDFTGNTQPDPTGHDPIGKVSTAAGEGESRGGLESLFNVSIHAGADGIASADGAKAITYSYAFSLTGGGEGQSAGVATTLKVTDPAHTYADDTIYLVKVSDTEIVGYVGNHVNEAGDHDGAIAIRITLTDANDLSGGQLVVEQYMPIDHGVDRNENDPSGDLNDFDSTQLLQLSGGASLGVTLTTTVTDGDGDKATDSATVVLANNDTSSIGFQDDGPAPLDISVANGAANGLFFGGFTPNNDQWGAGSGINTTGEAGGWHIAPATHDGAANVQLERVGDGYRGADSPTDSVMVDMEATPGNLKLTQDIPDLSAGTHHLTFEIGAASDAAAGSAQLEVFWNGVSLGIYTPQSGVMQTISIDVTAHDGTNTLTFEEVGTAGDNTGTFLANVKLGGLVIIDETQGIDPGSDDVDASQVSALFASVQGLKGSDPDMGGQPQYAHGKDPVIVLGTPDFGTDGPGTVKVELGVSAPNGVDSGLMTTDGKEIYLFAENGLVVGRYDADGDHTPDTAAFALHIGADGTLSIVQYVSLHHPDTGSNDEGIYLKPGTVQAIVTVTDGDGDHATSSTDISGTVRFEDDGPSISGGDRDWTFDEDVLTHGNDAHDVNPDNNDRTVIADKALGVHWGADGAKALTFITTGDHTNPVITVRDDNGTPVTTPLSSGGVELTYVITSDGHGGETLTAYKGDDHSPSNVIFTLTLNPDGDPSGAFSFELKGPLDHPDGGGESKLNLSFGFTATDGDDDTASSTITIRITDDIPVTTGKVIERTVDEDDIHTVWSHGSHPDDGPADGSTTEDSTGAAIVSGSLAGLVSGGSDLPGKFSFTNNAKDILAGLHLSSKQTATGDGPNGKELIYKTSAGPDGSHEIIITGYEPNPQGNPVFSLTLNTETGQYEFRLYDELVHMPGDGQNSDLHSGDDPHGIPGLDLGSIINYTDHDGDSVNLGGKFTVTITDDVPHADVDLTGGSVDVDESGGNNADNTSANSVRNLFAALEATFVHGQRLVGDDPDVTGDNNGNTSGNGAIAYAHSDGAVVTDHSAIGADAPGYQHQYTLSVVGGADSGLQVTDGSHILLSVRDGMIIGTVQGGEFNGKVAFAIAVGSDGEVSVAQYLSIKHDDKGDPNESNDNGGNNSDASPNDTPNPIQQSLDGKVAVTLTVTDSDGDQSTDTVNIGKQITFLDDGPSVGSNKTVTLEDEDVRGVNGNEGGPGDDSAPQNAQGTLSHDYGADGAGSTKLTGVDLPSHMGFESHVSNDGKTIIIEQNGHDVLKIELTDSKSGDYKVTQLGAIDHPSLDGQNGDNTENNVEFTVKYSVTDADGDSVTGSLTINVDDDTPEPNFVLKSGTLVTIDETPGLQNDDTNKPFPVNVDNHGHPGAGSDFETTVAQSHGSIVTGNANYGADGPGKTVFTIDIPGGDSTSSGLSTADGHTIKLFEEGPNLIVGRYDTHDGNISSSDPAAFAIYINPTTGEMSVVQYVAIKHDDRGDFDESDDNGKSSGDAQNNDHPDPVQQSIIDGAVRVTVTVTDHDGDSAQQQFNVGSQIVFEDDGPSVGSNKTVALEDDDLQYGNEGGPGDDSAPQNAQGTLSHEYGADGAGSTKLTGVDLPSNMGFTSHVSDDGKTIIIEQNGHDVLKIELTDSTSGDYKVTQLGAIDHPSLDGKTGDNTENNVEFTVKYTVTDADGDSVNGSLTVNVDDDTPEPNFVLKAGTLVTIDETPGLQNDDTNNAFPKNVSNPGHPGAGSGFETTVAQSHGSIVTGNANYGADGPGKTVFSIDIPGGDSASSGLSTTDGHAIKLFEEGGLIVGRYDTHNGNVTSGDPAAFAIYINPTTGEMSVVQYVAIKHDDRGDFDESNDNGKGSGDANPSEHDDPVQQSIIDGAVRVTVTVTDHDGDSAQQQFNVGSQIVFQDDGPSITITASDNNSVQLTTHDADTVGQATDVSTADFSGVFTTTKSFGADGAGSTSFGYKLAITAQADQGGRVDSHLDSQGKSIYLYDDGHGNIIGSTASDKYHISTDNTIFKLTVDSNGVVKLTQYAEIDHPISNDPSRTDAPFGDDHAVLGDNLISLTRSGSITDGDGDTATDSAKIDLGGNIRFEDDGPRVTALAEKLSVDEANLPSDRNPTNPHGSIIGIAQSDGGSLHINWGADNSEAKYLTFAKDEHGNVIGPDLTSDGAKLLYEIQSAPDSPGNEQLVAYKEGDASHTPVFLVTLYETGNGSYTYVQFQNIDHTGSGADPREFNFNIVAHDADGDTVQQTLTIDVKDDVPTAGNTSLAVDEDDLSTGNADVQDGDNLANPSPVVINDHLSFTAGADGLKSLTFETMTGAVHTTGGAAVTMGHVALTYVWVGNTLWATTDAAHPSDANSAFKVTITDASTGAYTFTLLHAVDHPLTDDSAAAPDKTSFEDNLDISLTFTVTDGDNDSKSTGTLSINIDDDSPVIGAPDTGSTSEANIAAATATAHGSLDIHFGADGPGTPGAPASSGTPHTIDFNSLPQGGLTHFTQDGFTFQTNEGIANTTGHTGQLQGSIITITNGAGPFTLTSLDLGFDGTSNGPQYDNITLIGTDTHGHQISVTVHLGVITPANAVGSGTPLATTFNAAGTDLAGVELTSLQILAPHNGDANGRAIVDNVVFNTGSAPLTHGDVSFTDLDTAINNITIKDDHGNPVTAATLTAHGETVHYALLDSMTLVGYTGNTVPTSIDGTNVVFSVVLSQDANNPNGAYDFTLRQPLDDLPSGAVSDLNFTFGFTAKDGDGDTVNGHFTVDVKDDVPHATAEGPQTVAEGASITGHLDFDGGADGASVTHIGDHKLTFGSDGWSSPIDIGAGTIKVKADGSYVFTADDAVHNPNGASVPVDTTFTVTDRDGDTSTADIHIGVTDANTPTGGESAATVDDDGLSGHNPANAAGDIDANVNDAIDDHNEAVFTGTLAGTMGKDGAGAFSFEGGVGNLGSEKLEFTWSGNTLTATVKESPDSDRIGTTLFTVVITNPATGDYKVTLNENVLHSTADNAENGDASIKLPYTVTDGDGSQADGNLTIKFNDDAPTAVADVNTVQSGDAVHGNVITDAAGHDAVGADGLASIVWSGASSEGILTGNHGILKVGSDGSYTYEAFANSPGQDSFSYTITDRDGDTSQTTLTITVSDGRPHLAAATAEVDEAALDTTKDDRPGDASDDVQASIHTGSDPTSDAETVSGSLTLDDADTPHVTSVKGSGATQNVGGGAITVDGAYGVLKIDANGHYTYTLTSNDPNHSSQGTGIDQQKDVFTYTVTDSHGNTSTSTITIDIKDDVPHATPGDPLSFAETAGPQNGTLDFVAGADGATVTHVKLPGTNSQFEDITTWALDGHGGYTKEVVGVGAYTFHADGSWTFDPENNSSTGNIDGSFSYRVTDGDGDISEATQTVTVTNANSLPTAGEATAGVDDDGLAHGNPGDANNGDVTLDSPENVAHGTLPHDYKADGPADSDPVGFAPMDGEHGKVGTEDVTYHWNETTNTLVATSDAGRGDIFKVVVDETTGKYELTLLKPVMHENVGGENDAAVELTYQVKDSSNDTAEGKLTVTFNDDTPVAHDQAASVTEGSTPTLNAILVIDLSASMNDNSGVQGLTRLELMQQAVANYLHSPGVHFNEIVIYTFNDGAHYEGTFSNVQDAINKVNSYDSNDLVAATEYDTTAEDVREHFEANVDLTPADQTHLLFLSDGDPTGGSALNTQTEQNNWRDFLNDAGVDKVYAVGFGGIDDTSFLNPMAPRAGDQAIAVENPDQLAATLEGSLPSEISGNILFGQDGVAGGGDDISFGADGGHIHSIKVGDVTYTYDPDTKDITASDGHNPTQNTPELTVTTPLGGTLEFNFQTGAWEYSAPPNGVSQTTDEHFKYEVIDGDGDTADATLTITVVDVPNAPPVLHLNEPGTSGNVSDTFSSSGYGGGSGWSGSWVESDDTGGTSSGDIRISGSGSSARLRFGDDSNSNDGAAGGATITRDVDLTNAVSAKLTFSVVQDGADNGEDLIIEAWNGTTWQEIGRVLGSDSNGTTNFDIDLTAAQMGPDSSIRFRMETGLDSDEFYYIDNVNIAYTTVTPFQDHVASFTENGDAISIAPAGPTITDTDDNKMESAKIVLTNAKSGDVLAVGDLPAGIDAHIDTSVAGQITVTLSGHASLADYQAAIKAVTYQNTSDNPGSDDRTIHVTVTDDHGNPSNVATTTVHVTPTNDPFTAVDDHILTNVTDFSAIHIPNAALLYNDTNPDGDALSVTNVSNQSGDQVSLGVTFDPTDPANTPTQIVKTYNFVGKTAGDGSHTAYYFEVDPSGSLTDITDLNALREGNSGFGGLTQATYSSIAASDNTRWTTPDPGNSSSDGDHAVFWAQFNVTESAASISQIAITVEGRQEGDPSSTEDGHLGVWNYATGAWESLNAGHFESPTSDGVWSFTLTGNIANYLDPATNQLTIAVVNEDVGEPLRIDYAEVKVTSSLPAGTLVDADFASNGADTGGFTYSDGVFGGGNPAGGEWVVGGHDNSGALHVALGGGSGNQSNMTGGWSQTITLAAAASVTIEFDYKLDLSGGTDNGENGRLLMSVDGTLHGLNGESYIAQLLGVSSTTTYLSTGWQHFSVTLDLDAGTHDLALGGLMTSKNSSDETADAFFDNVKVSAGSYVFTDGSLDYTATDGTTPDTGHVDITATQGSTIEGTANGEILLAGGGNDTLHGNGGNDYLIGGLGNDILDGGNDNDVLVGGAGLDTLTGGAGADHFRFEALSEGGDHIVDFQHGTDSIDLLLSSFSALAGPAGTTVSEDDFKSANSANEAQHGDIGSAHLVYYQGTGANDPGKLYYDADGGDDANRTLIAILDNHAQMTASDIHKV